MSSSTVHFPRLATSTNLGSMHLNNRTVLASMTRSRASDETMPNALMTEYYTQRSGPSGAGLILTEGIYISPQGGDYTGVPGLWDEEHAEAWRPLVDAVHAKGTQIIAQLWHVGRIANNDRPLQKKWGEPVYGPSAVRARGAKYRQLPGQPGNSEPVAIPDPTVILDQYEHAARMAKLAGFDGVDLGGANGYLLAQFLSDTANLRTDQWGGSIENRARFPIEAAKRLIKVWGADRVGYKMSPAGGFNDITFTSIEACKETFHYLVKELDQLGLAYLQIIEYDKHGDATGVGFDFDVLAEFRGDVENTPFMGGEGYDGTKAEALLKAGKIDAVAFGKGFITNPDYYKRIQAGAETTPLTDLFTLYNIKDDKPELGYTDFPFLSQSIKA